MAIEAAGVKLYNLKEVSEQVGLSVTTLKGYVSRGTIKGRKIGRAWHVTEDELRRYLTESTEQKAA